MKLLARTSLIYLLSTTLVFLLGGLIFYSNLRHIVDEETTEHVVQQKLRLEDFVKKHDSLPALSYDAGKIDFIREVAVPVKETFSDTSCYNPEEDEILPYRRLLFPVKAKGKNYAVSVSKPLFESDDLVETILYSFISILAVLLVVVLLVNRMTAGKLWRPFFNTVKQLHDFEIDDQRELHFSPTSTFEFRELNAALEKMTQKTAAAYKNLKAFTENASHELQTPLSVIMNVSEQLLQQKNADSKTLEDVQRIHLTARKLSKLNQALLLLAKIENRQFQNKETVDWSEILDSRMELYADIIAHKEIQLEKKMVKGFSTQIHPALAEVLVSNLLINAIRHNTKGGRISISLDKEKLRVCNSGAALQSGEQVFERFYKENPSSESSGLGLAIVKQVAETNGMQVRYIYTGGQHCFEVWF